MLIIFEILNLFPEKQIISLKYILICIVLFFIILLGIYSVIKNKENYRLTMEQALGSNKGYLITYFANARITLMQENDRYNKNLINLYYTKEEHPTFKKFASDVSSDDF